MKRKRQPAPEQEPLSEAQESMVRHAVAKAVADHNAGRHTRRHPLLEKLGDFAGVEGTYLLAFYGPGRKIGPDEEHELAERMVARARARWGRAEA